MKRFRYWGTDFNIVAEYVQGKLVININGYKPEMSLYMREGHITQFHIREYQTEMGIAMGLPKEYWFADMESTIKWASNPTIEFNHNGNYVVTSDKEGNIELKVNGGITPMIQMPC